MSKYNKGATKPHQVAAKLGVTGLDGMFEKIDGEGKQRIIAASFGEVGTLKTSFWLTAPGPILIQSLDRGTEGVADVYMQAHPKKSIYLAEYDANTHKLVQEDDAQAAAEEVAAKIESDFIKAIKEGVRTIFWDKETQIYEIFKYAMFGAPSDAPSNYYGLFQRYRALINEAKDADINFGVIQGMKTPWVSEMKATGKMGAKPSTKDRVRRGMPEIEELMHLNLEHVIDGDGDFMINIGKVRGPGAREIQNKTVPYMEFPAFATLVFPLTEESDWM